MWERSSRKVHVPHYAEYFLPKIPSPYATKTGHFVYRWIFLIADTKCSSYKWNGVYSTHTAATLEGVAAAAYVIVSYMAILYFVSPHFVKYKCMNDKCDFICLLPLFVVHCQKVTFSWVWKDKRSEIIEGKEQTNNGKMHMSTDCRLLSTHAVVIVAAMPVGGSSNGVEI